MSKKVKLFNTAVKKPDGTWLGGAALGFKADSDKALSFAGAGGVNEYDGWKRIYVDDTVVMASRVHSIRPVRSPHGTNISKKIFLKTSFPVDELAALDVNVNTWINTDGTRTNIYYSACNGRKTAGMNGTMVEYRLTCDSSTPVPVEWNDKWDAYTAREFIMCSRAAPPKKREVPALDENGEEIKDENGNVVTEVFHNTAGNIAKVFAVADSYRKAVYPEAYPREDGGQTPEARVIHYGANWSYNDGVGFNEDGSPAGKLNVKKNGVWGGLMECDTYVLMCLTGIMYDNSPYAAMPPEAFPTYDQNDIADALINSEYGLNWMNREFDAAGNVIFNNSLGTSAISDTGEMLRDFWRRGWCFSAQDDEGSFDPSLVDDGDVIIFRNPERRFFDCISHIGIVFRDEETGELWLYHVSSKDWTTEEHTLGRCKLMDYISGKDIPPERFYFIRPDYSIKPGEDLYNAPSDD